MSFVSLGCPKNLIDSERMLAQLAQRGVIPTAEANDADVIVINTCGFLEASKQESLAFIREAVARKRIGRATRVVVAGCLVTRMGRELIEAVPGIDALVSVSRRDDIVAAVTHAGRSLGEAGAAATDVPALFLQKAHGPAPDDAVRLRLTPRHYAYLRISEGCSQGCSFCTIPAIRGPLRSKPIEAIEAETRELIEDGALELNLIGQDTTGYGRDIGFAGGLAELIGRLDRLPGACWIRLLYAYPSGLTDAVIDAVASAEHVVPYVDVPLQHVSDRILKLMRRRGTRRQIEALLEKLRRRIPGVSIRTTFITGFPGETAAEHRELLQFIRDFGFDMMGVFCYSAEASTPAGRRTDQCRDAVKRRRQAELMSAQQEVVARRNAERLGLATDVLIDQAVNDDRVAGRTPGQAPEVDSLTYLARTGTLAPGQLVPARIVGHEDYDLIAKATGPPTRQTPRSADTLLPIYQPIGVAAAHARRRLEQDGTPDDEDETA